MTDPRYSNSKLAKWYYSRNRTISDGTEEYYLLNKAEVQLEDGTIILGTNKLIDKLNELAEENQRLKAFIKRLTNNCGEIILMNGMGYKVDKILR